MRPLETIITVIALVMLLFQGYIIYANNLYEEKINEYIKKAPISAYYANNSLVIYNRKEYYIKSVNGEIINSSNSTISLYWETCPRTLKIDTNKGLYIINYIKCK